MTYRSYYGPNLNSLWVLIGINLVLFIARMVSPNLIILLGLQAASLSSQPWTILTNLFMHANLGHIIANMLTLYFFGSHLLSLVGQRKFLITYFVGGIAGSLFYIRLGDPFIPAVGASGAVFAIGGALTMLRPKLSVLVFPIPAPIPLWAAVIGGFVILSFFPSVAWQAHLGGLIVGLIAGYFFRRKERRNRFR